MKDRYQIEETSCRFSFMPFYHHRAKFKWYIILILLFVGLLVNYYKPMNGIIFLTCSTLLILTIWIFLKELLLYIPIRYTFDVTKNEVYQRNLLISQRKIMFLDEMVIYKSFEMGSWQYKIGKKKSQFVKSYVISEYFYGQSDNEKSIAYDLKIVNKLEKMVASCKSKIPINSSHASYTN